MNGINLHDLVRAGIEYVHPDEVITYYQSTGQKNTAGLMTPTYAAPVAVKAQIQNDNDAALFHADRAGLNSSTIKGYVYADSATPPAGIVRPFGRTGDLFRRLDNTWWLVTAVIKNFESVEWVCLRATLQVAPPALEVEA